MNISMINKFTINEENILTIIWNDFRRIQAKIKDISLFRLTLPISSREKVFREIERDESNYEWVYTSD